MNSNVRTTIPFNLTASSSSSPSNDRNLSAPRRVSSRIHSGGNSSSFVHNFRGFDFAKNLIFHSQNRSISAERIRRCSLSVYANSGSLELPLLPFDVKEVLVPTESKRLHLYEARYLALLEESLSRKDKLFVHFVLDPIVVSDTSGELSFAARYGCLVLIENADPYLRGVILPVRDDVPEDASRLCTKMVEVKDALHNLNSLEIKLKAPKEALLQTRVFNSLIWTEKEIFEDIDENFTPSLAERVSFAAFQPISGSTQSELQSLQLKKLEAMDIKNTLERLDESLELTKVNISTVAAKLAIQSVELQ